MTPEQRTRYVADMGARHHWWALAAEPALAPDRAIVDAHVHFWQAQQTPDPAAPGRSLQTSRFMPDDFRAQTGGHRVAGLVYVECGSGYDQSLGPDRAAVGETRFAVAQGAALAAAGGPPLLGIAAHADLRAPDLDQLIDAHEAAGAGQLRSIRQGGARLENPDARLLAGKAEPGLYRQRELHRGLARLAERNLAFEAFLFSDQLDDLVLLATQATLTTVVINHLGTPVGFGRPDDGDARVYDDWRRRIEQLAKFPNLMMKLGGIASPVTEYDGGLRPAPPTSDQFVTERGAYFHAAIQAFGADRCLFESNFPVDSVAIPYGTLWNSYKIIADSYPEDAGDRLLAGTAKAVYGPVA